MTLPGHSVIRLLSVSVRMTLPGHTSAAAGSAPSAAPEPLPAEDLLHGGEHEAGAVLRPSPGPAGTRALRRPGERVVSPSSDPPLEGAGDHRPFQV